MPDPIPGQKIDIYTKKWLAQKWCKSDCYLKEDCKPNFFAQGVLGLGLDVRVKGKINVSECPIACRWKPNPNNIPVLGSGDCGETTPENPIE